MPDADPLTPADAADVAEALAFALRYKGRKRFRQGNEYMATITADHLVEHLARAGFVVMRRPPVEGGSALAVGWKPKS